MSKWREIRNDFVCEDSRKIYIDAWTTDDDNEDGIVLARIDMDTKRIEYFDEDAKTDEYAQEVIAETMMKLNKETEVNKMKTLISVIENAKRYVKGELELDLVEDVWVAMDYREDLGGAFPIEVKEFNARIITVSEAESCNIDVRKCCDICGIAYVG